MRRRDFEAGLAAAFLVGCGQDSVKLQKEYDELAKDAAVSGHGEIKPKVGSVRWVNFTDKYKFNQGNLQEIYDFCQELGANNRRYPFQGEICRLALYDNIKTRHFYLIKEDAPAITGGNGKTTQKVPAETNIYWSGLAVSYVRDWLPPTMSDVFANTEEAVNFYSAVEAAQSVIEGKATTYGKGLVVQEGFNNGVGRAYIEKMKGRDYQYYVAHAHSLPIETPNLPGIVLPSIPITRDEYRRLPVGKIVDTK